VSDDPGSVIEVTWDAKSDSYSSATLTTFDCFVDDDNGNQCSTLNITKDGKYLFVALYLFGSIKLLCIDLEKKTKVWAFKKECGKCDFLLFTMNHL